MAKIKKTKYQLEVEKILSKSEAGASKELKSLYADLISEVTADIIQLQKEIEADDKFSKKLQKERLEAIRSQMAAKIEQLDKDQKQSIWSFLRFQGDTAFNSLFYEFEMSEKIPLTFSMLTDKQLNVIINTPVASRKLSTRLQGNSVKMKKNLNRVLSRGFAKGLSTQKMARQIAEIGGATYKRSMNIARTEAGRVTGITTQQSQEKAAEAGVDLEKQWVSTLDGSTRHNHQKLDGQVREIDDYFEVDGKKALQPHMFGRPEEDINCRCRSISKIKGYDHKLRRDNKSHEVIGYKNYEEWHKDAKKRDNGKAGERVKPEYTDQQLKAMMAWKPPRKKEEILVEEVNFAELGFLEKADFQTDSDSWVAELEPSQVSAMKDYTADAYSKMNKMLRNEKYIPKNSEHFNDLMRNLEEALSKFELKHDIITYRGVSAAEYESILSSDVFKEFKSTSLDKEMAESFLNFSKNKDGKVVMFKIPKGTNGAYLGTNSSIKTENEFLLNRGVGYSVEMVNDVLEVTINGK